MSSGTAIPGGILFGPNGSEKRYLSVYARTADTVPKSKWAVPSQEQYEVFCAADDGNW